MDPVSEKYQQAINCHQAGRIDEAETIYIELLNEKPDDAHLHYLLSAIYFAKNELDRAHAEINKAIELNDSSAAYLCLLGVLHMLKFDFDSATDALNRALLIDPNNVEALLKLGLIDIKLKRFEVAEQRLMKAYQLDANQLEVHVTLGFLYNETKRFEQAKDIFQSILNKMPEHPMANNGIGMAYLGLDDLGPAETYLRKAFGLEEKNSAHHVSLSRLFVKQGKYEWARGALDTATDLSDSPEHYCELGRVLELTNFLKEAGDNFLKALKRNPSDLEAQLLLASNSLKREEYSRAVDQYNAILRNHPENIDALNGLSLACFKDGRDADAETALARLTELEGKQMLEALSSATG